MWPDLKHVLKIYVLNKFLMENYIFLQCIQKQPRNLSSQIPVYICSCSFFYLYLPLSTYNPGNNILGFYNVTAWFVTSKTKLDI